MTSVFKFEVAELIFTVQINIASPYASFNEKIISTNLAAQAVAYSVFKFELIELIECIFLHKISCGESILLL